jgi:two-component system response regulator PilR (NtrC family)
MLSAVPPAKIVRVVRTYRTDSRADELGTTLIGDSDLMMELKRLVLLIARSEETVLITGESGTGKELIAHAIHDLSHRRDKPFLAVNCGALAESLLESELFGHVKGAFTGATTNKKGYFEAASSGTIFLDEFAEMSLTTQQRLLRVLQERTVRPVGSTEPKEIAIDARVIVATNHDLAQDVVNGKFRKDLYYRVNVLEIRAPALRDRLEDVLPLAQHFLCEYNLKNSCQVSEGINASVIAVLKQYSWPGNVRELQNIIKRLAISAFESGVISEDHTRHISELNSSVPRPADSDSAAMSHQTSIMKRSLAAIQTNRHRCASCEELEVYRRKVSEVSGNVTEAARQLRIPRSTLQRKLKRLYTVA